MYDRPDNAYRIDYLDIMWEEDIEDRKLVLPNTIYKDLPSLVEASIYHSNKNLYEFRT